MHEKNRTGMEKNKMTGGKIAYSPQTNNLNLWYGYIGLPDNKIPGRAQSPLPIVEHVKIKIAGTNSLMCLRRHGGTRYDRWSPTSVSATLNWTCAVGMIKPRAPIPLSTALR